MGWNKRKPTSRELRSRRVNGVFQTARAVMRGTILPVESRTSMTESSGEPRRLAAVSRISFWPFFAVNR